MISTNGLKFHTKLLVLQILTRYQNCTHQTKKMVEKSLYGPLV